MMKCCRPLAFAAVLHVIAGIGTASAQTLLVRNAPPGSTVEAVVNSTTVGTAAADARGDATVPLNLQATLNKPQIDANIFLDVCGTTRRVHVVERGQQPGAPAADCERREIAGLFLVRRITTLVVNSGATTPSVLLVQGNYDPTDPDVARPRRLAPNGLILFGGAGLTKSRDTKVLACGNVSECDGGGFDAGYAGGAAYWIVPFVAAELTYMKPGDAVVDGSGEGFHFNTFLTSDVATVAGLVGGPIGALRLYGRAGANFHRGTFGTTQTVEDKTVTVAGVTQTIPGGTQNFELKTKGWGWLFGGGFEVWFRPSVAIYGDVGFIGLKGSPVDESEGLLNDRITSLMIGAKIKIGR